MVARAVSLPSSSGCCKLHQGDSRQEDHLCHRQGRPEGSPDDSSITSSHRPVVTSTNRLSAATAKTEEEEETTRTTTAGVMTTAAVRTALPVINEGAVVTLRHYIDLAASNCSNSWNKSQHHRDHRSDCEDNRSCSDRAATPPSPSNHFRQVQQQLQQQQQQRQQNGDCSTSPPPMTTTLALLPAKLRQESSSTVQSVSTPRQSNQSMPAIVQHPGSASSNTQRPVFSRSGSATDQSLPSIVAATHDASTRRESNGSSTAAADAVVVRAFERPRLLSVEDQPWSNDRGRQRVTLESANSCSLAGTAPTARRDHLVSTGTDWSVFDDDQLHHHQYQQQDRVESAGDRMDTESNPAMHGGSVPAESAMDVVTTECSARFSTVVAASKSTSRVNNPVRKTSKCSDAVFSSMTPGRLTRSNRTVSVSNLSKISGDGAGAGQTAVGVGGWRRGPTGTNVNENGTNTTASTQLQRHRSELNVNRLGFSSSNNNNNSNISNIQRSPYAQTNFTRPRQTATQNATPRKDVDAQLTSTNRSRQGLVKSSSQPILRRETTYGNLQRLNNNNFHQRQVPARAAAAAADDDEDGDRSGDGDEPTETDKRQRIVEWLDGVDEDAERPPSPEIFDEPPQTDTAIHIVYGGD